MPRITARIASDIVSSFRYDRFQPKSRALLAYSFPCRNRYSAKTRLARCVRLGSLTLLSAGLNVSLSAPGLLRRLTESLHVHAVSPRLLSAFALHSPGARRIRPGFAAGGGAVLVTAGGFSSPQPGLHHARPVHGGTTGDPRRGDHRRVHRRDPGRRDGREAAAAVHDGRAHRGAPADGVVQREVL